MKLPISSSCASGETKESRNCGLEQMPKQISEGGRRNRHQRCRLQALLCAMVALTLLMGGAPANSAPSFPEIETTWPGVRFQLFRIERNSLNRLVVAVRIVAIDKAPPSGTFLGTKTPIPANASPIDIDMGAYDPKPFSLAAAEMTDDETGKKYFVLPPIAPPGMTYLPGTTAKSLLPGQAEILTVQFAIPPSPPGNEFRKQTASFLFPNAKGPITKVPIPPPTEVVDSPNQSR